MSSLERHKKEGEGSTSPKLVDIYGQDHPLFEAVPGLEESRFIIEEDECGGIAYLDHVLDPTGIFTVLRHASPNSFPQHYPKPYTVEQIARLTIGVIDDWQMPDKARGDDQESIDLYKMHKRYGLDKFESWRNTWIDVLTYPLKDAFLREQFLPRIVRFDGTSPQKWMDYDNKVSEYELLMAVQHINVSRGTNSNDYRKYKESRLPLRQFIQNKLLKYEPNVHEYYPPHAVGAIKSYLAESKAENHAPFIQDTIKRTLETILIILEKI